MIVIDMIEIVMIEETEGMIEETADVIEMTGEIEIEELIIEEVASVQEIDLDQIQEMTEEDHHLKEMSKKDQSEVIVDLEMERFKGMMKTMVAIL